MMFTLKYNMITTTKSKTNITLKNEDLTLYDQITLARVENKKIITTLKNQKKELYKKNNKLLTNTEKNLDNLEKNTENVINEIENTNNKIHKIFSEDCDTIKKLKNEANNAMKTLYIQLEKTAEINENIKNSVNDVTENLCNFSENVITEYNTYIASEFEILATEPSSNFIYGVSVLTLTGILMYLCYKYKSETNLDTTAQNIINTSTNIVNQTPPQARRQLLVTSAPLMGVGIWAFIKGIKYGLKK